MRAPRARPAVEALGSYRPGRSAAQAAAAHGLASAVKLASNEMPFGPLPGVEAALERAARDVNRYPDHLATELRSRLAVEVGVDERMVAVGPGSVGLLQQLCLAYAEPGDEIAFAWPSFEAYPIFTGLVGAAAVKVPLAEETVDIDRLAGATTDRTRLILIANPNNPTSTAVPVRRLGGLARTLPPRCLLVVDEAYCEFVDARIGSAVELVHDHPNVAVLRTFSKAYGLAAARVGYLVAHADVVASVDRALIPFAVNALAQAGALAALDAQSEMRRRVDVVVRERTRLSAAVRALGFDVPPSQANFLWLPVRAGAVPLAVELERRGVVVRPFDGVGVRVTVGSPDENDMLLDALGDVVGSLDLGRELAS